MKLLQSKLLKPIVPVLKITGTINQLSGQQFIRSLRSLDTTRAIALAVCVNSRGGFPVQSQIVTTSLTNFINKRKLKLLTFTSDYALSAGYSILCMGDEVYADKSSLIGSIGVVWKKYTASNFLDELGAKYHTIQTQKSMRTIMSPFKEISNDQRQFLQHVSKKTHEKFIAWVKEHRKNKINLNNSQYLFSGAALTSGQALDNGLIDGFGSVTQVLQKKYPQADIYYHKLIQEKEYVPKQ